VVDPSRPIGPAVDATPATRPGAVELSGSSAKVEKLDPSRHAGDLWEAARGDDRLWDYMAYGPFPDEAGFAHWLDERAVMLDPFSYVVSELASGKAAGIVTLMEIRPAMRVCEIGGIVYTDRLQRTPAATEAQYLMARHVFEDLGYRRYEWKCNALNAASRRAALRLGFTFEGIFRRHMIVKGRNRDTAWFSITDEEWPSRKSAFERWLDPENFDATGRQRVSLSALNTPALGDDR
jgi:RimJ/RimL family protein N-acetyltransferase